MKLLNLSEYEISHLAYLECLNGNNTSEMRRLITHSEWASKYCAYIKNSKEMRSKITDSWWAEEYCTFVGYDAEVAKYIKNKDEK